MSSPDKRSVRRKHNNRFVEDIRYKHRRIARSHRLHSQSSGFIRRNSSIQYRPQSPEYGENYCQDIAENAYMGQDSEIGREIRQRCE